MGQREEATVCTTLGDPTEVGEFRAERLEEFEKQRDERREELGNRADRLVEAYDALIGATQQRLPAAFDQPSG